MIVTIFSQSADCPFTLLMASFDAHVCFNFNKVQFLYFLFCCQDFWCHNRGSNARVAVMKLSPCILLRLEKLLLSLVNGLSMFFSYSIPHTKGCFWTSFSISPSVWQQFAIIDYCCLVVKQEVSVYLPNVFFIAASTTGGGREFLEIPCEFQDDFFFCF